jgi:exodeoxyribonuclease VIII
MSVHVMLDIETLGTGPNALIASIGAVKFDPHHLCSDAGEQHPILDKFHVGVEFVSAQQHGGTIDASTVGWWLQPDRDAARQLLLALDRVDIGSALEGFAQWFGDESLPVWGNGATFDNVIVRSAYTRLGLPNPWKFWHDRCYRTLASLAPDLIKQAPRVAHHDALADAEWQALRLQEIVQQFGLTL